MFKQTKKWLEKKQFKYEKIDKIKYPTKTTIIDIHDFLIELFIKEGETAHKGILFDAPLTFDGIKFYENVKDDKKEDIIFKGALIFNLFLQAGHPFIDGNKRTGFITLWLFLALNGCKLKLSSFDYIAHLEKINKWAMTTDKDNIPEIAAWIRRYLV